MAQPNISNYHYYGFDDDIEGLYTANSRIREIIKNNTIVDERQDVEITENLNKITNEITRSTDVDEDTVEALEKEINDRKESEKLMLERIKELEAVVNQLDPKKILTVDNIKGGDNVKVTIAEDKSVNLDITLSDNFQIDDTYNQNLPKKGDNLDTFAKKLSEASKLLSDTTDGETF